MKLLADVPQWARALAAGALAYAALGGLWPEWLTPGLSLLMTLLLLPLLASLVIMALFMAVQASLVLQGQHGPARQWLAPSVLLIAAGLIVPTLQATALVRDVLLVVPLQQWSLPAGWSDGRMIEGPLGLDAIVDAGPPVRIAFMTSPGFLDNWSGIVFDPTGKVMLADGWDASGKFRAPEAITKLFDGDLVSCRHLWGDYYRCSFT